MAQTIKGIVVRDFRDSGTKQRFEAGAEHDFTPGEHANYLAAGLIRRPEAKSAPAKPAAGA